MSVVEFLVEKFKEDVKSAKLDWRDRDELARRLHQIIQEIEGPDETI